MPETKWWMLLGGLVLVEFIHICFGVMTQDPAERLIAGSMVGFVAYLSWKKYNTES